VRRIHTNRKQHRLSRQTYLLLDLRLVLDDIVQVLADHVRQPLELPRPLVLDAKVEGAFARPVVRVLELVVVLQRLQHVAVALPEELEPRVQNVLVRPARIVHGHHQHLFRVHLRVEVAHLRQRLVRACLGVGRLRLGHVQQMLHDGLERPRGVQLGDAAVLEEPLLGHAEVLELHAELHELFADILVHRRPLAVTARLKDVVEGVEGELRVFSGDQLWDAQVKGSGGRI
jgi:hypothetical protein